MSRVSSKGAGIEGEAAPAGATSAASDGTQGSSSAAAPDDGTSSADPATPTEDELLAGTDLPAGSTLRSLDIRQLAAALVSAAGRVEFNPAECGGLGTKALGDPNKLDGVATIASVGNPPAGQITESLLRKQPGVSPAGIRSALRTCGNATGTGPQGTVKVTTVEIGLPGVDAAEKIAYHQHATGGLYGPKGIDIEEATIVLGDKLLNIGVIENPRITLLEIARKALAKGWALKPPRGHRTVPLTASPCGARNQLPISRCPRNRTTTSNSIS